MRIFLLQILEVPKINLPKFKPKSKVQSPKSIFVGSMTKFDCSLSALNPEVILKSS